MLNNIQHEDLRETFGEQSDRIVVWELMEVRLAHKSDANTMAEFWTQGRWLLVFNAVVSCMSTMGGMNELLESTASSAD